MDDDLVFCRTPKGQAEAAAAAGALDPMHKRCLALVDGKTNVGEMASQFRPGEIALVLGELQAAGFVAIADTQA